MANWVPTQTKAQGGRAGKEITPMKEMRAQCPITYFEKNLIFNTSGSCWGVYKLGGFNYDFKGNATKIETLARLVELIKGLTFAKLLIVPTTEPVEVHAEKIRRDIIAKNKNDPLADEARRYLDLTCDYLNEQHSDSWKDYSCFLVVKIRSAAVNSLDMTMGQLLATLQAPIYTLTALLGLSDNEITTEKYKRFLRLEGEVYKTLSGCMSMKRATPSEIQWLLKRSVLRGTGKVPQLNRTVKTDTQDGRWYKEYTTDWTPCLEQGKLGRVEYYRPNKADVSNLFEGRLSCNGNKGVRVVHADGVVSYQSYIVLTGIPDALQFPGCEWIYQLQQLPLPLEICIDLENTNNKKARDELNKKGVEINTQYENVMRANVQMPNALNVAQLQLDTLRQELEDNKLPMSNVRVSICVSGDQEEQLDDNVKLLMEALAELDFTTARPIADQMKLFYQHLPGTESYAAAFNRKMSAFMLACGIFGASNTVGDDVGYYFGSANGKPAYLRLGQACLCDSSPAGSFYGGLGQGKSLNANVLLFLHVLFGAYGLVICPKGERSHWQSMPILGPYVNMVEFSVEPKNKGKLDPFNIFRDNIHEATALATNILMDLLEIAPKSDEHIILLECLNRVQLLQLPSMEALLSEILRVPRSDIYFTSAQKLHRTLQALKANGMVQLFFGNGSENAIAINGRLNVIMLNGITLPDRDTNKKDYSPEEKNATLLMSVISSISKKFAHLHPGREKVTLIDESWMLTATTAGSSLMEYHSRMGRSLFHVLLLNGHSVLDLPSEKMRGAITYKFCFNPKDEKEAVRMLEYMRLDQTDTNVAVLMNLRPGECLFSDLYDRVALLHFDPVFDDIFNFFKTTPTPDDDRHTAPLQATGDVKGNDNREELSQESDEELNRLFERLVRAEIA